MKAVTGAQFCKALRRHGWQHVRTRGSHQTWSLGAVKVTVPVHAGQDLPRGLLAALLKQSGLSESDL